MEPLVAQIGSPRAAVSMWKYQEQSSSDAVVGGQEGDMNTAPFRGQIHIRSGSAWNEVIA